MGHFKGHFVISLKRYEIGPKCLVLNVCMLILYQAMLKDVEIFFEGLALAQNGSKLVIGP